MSDAKWSKLREVITYNSEHGPYYDPEGEPLDMKEIKRCFAFVWWKMNDIEETESAKTAACLDCGKDFKPISVPVFCCEKCRR